MYECLNIILQTHIYMIAKTNSTKFTCYNNNQNLTSKLIHPKFTLLEKYPNYIKETYFGENLFWRMATNENSTKPPNSPK